MTMTLKPCPFCGNTKPTFERLGTPRQSCIVACGYCGCRNESSDEGDDCGETWNERAIEAELSKQKPVARPRLPRIDHFAREAFEKFASGVECELTNYRWFEAGWDARGDTVAAAPLPSAPAQSITDYMMDLVDRLGHEAENVDPKAWQHLLVYAPKPSAPDTVQVPDPKPRWFDI